MATRSNLLGIKTLSAVAIVALCFAFSATAQAATRTITTLADSGPGSLRDALANSANGDTIDFSVTGTIVPASTLPITTGVTIIGPGAGSLTIDGNKTVHLFTVNGSGITVSISGLTLTRATSSQSTGTGGAIENGAGVAALTVADCVFSNNYSSFGGGAIANETTAGTLTITNCTFNTNEASRNGGAIYNPNGRALTITNSTFMRNVAPGLQNLAQGGAVYHLKANSTGETIPVSITGCTFTANIAGKTSGSNGNLTAGGAIYYSPSGDSGESLTVTNCTFTNNASTIGTTVASDTSAVGGAIYAGGPDVSFQAPPQTVTISGSTFTGNTVFGGDNLYAPAYGGAVYFGAGGVSISTSNFSSNTATDNGRRQSYGGAIYYLGVDPRGLTITDCFVTNNTANAAPGSTSFSSAGGGLYVSNGSDGSGSTPAPVVITRTSFTGNKCINIYFAVGGGIDKDGVGPLTIADSTISNNSAPGGFGRGGGLVAGQGALSISNSTMDGNVAGDTASNASFGDGMGGAIYAGGTTTSITGSKLTNNKAAGNGDSFGGAMRIVTGTVTITTTTLSGNSVSSVAGRARGGAIQNGDPNNSVRPNTTVKDSTISGNSLSAGGTSNPGDAEGAGVSISDGGSFALRNSTVSGNAARATGSGVARGGGLFLATASSILMSVDDSTIANNSAACSSSSSCGVGGGIFNSNSGSFTICNTIIALNSAGGTGRDESGTITSLGYNLVGNGDGSTGFGTMGDQVGTSASPIDPKLAVLGSYNGPTQTLGLVSNSPAINAGNPNFDATTLPKDQRGMARVRAGRLDIGAYEAAAPPVITAPANNSRVGPTPLLTADAEPFATVIFTITGGSSPVMVTRIAGADGKVSGNSPALAEANYTVTAVAEVFSELPSPVSNTRSFVVDTTPPVISGVPADITAEATGPNGATVTYSQPTADDNFDGPVPVSCAPASGSTFAFGTTMVTCSASDQAGNTSRSSFNITVRDTTAPTFSNVPANITAEATGPNGAVVSYTPPTARDAVSGDRPVTCSPGSGSAFAFGTNTVTCTATDAANNTGTATFTVTVRDTTPPTISNVPADMTKAATGPDGAVVTYNSPTAQDAVSGNVPVTCSPASGSKFPIGTTMVTCTATDAANNTASATFKVTVEAPSPTPTPTATPTPTPSGGPAQPLNLSTRSNTGTGDNVMIGGFIIQGSEAKKVVIRGIGPSSGVAGSLQDPVLELHGPAGFQTIVNDNWQDARNASDIPQDLQPKDTREAAILVTLQPGAYTGIVTGKNGSTGIALVEVYDLSFSSASQLANISTRANLGAGDNTIIGGFMLGGNAGTTVPVVVRAIGPSLNANGIQNALADPTVRLVDKEGTVVASNNNWEDDAAQAKKVSDLGLAPKNRLESAIYATLAPGAYTAVLGSTGGSGIAVVEIYHVQ
ncbi:MAG: beta strand repeat-containing protein [Chthoniobacterales bacterium]